LPKAGISLPNKEAAGSGGVGSTGEPDPVQRCSPIRDISTCSLHDEHFTVGMKRDSLPTVAILECPLWCPLLSTDSRREVQALWCLKSGSGCEVPKSTCPPGLLPPYPIAGERVLLSSDRPSSKPGPRETEYVVTDRCFCCVGPGVKHPKQATADVEGNNYLGATAQTVDSTRRRAGSHGAPGPIWFYTSRAPTTRESRPAKPGCARFPTGCTK
jgi:hypothetical protein